MRPIAALGAVLVFALCDPAFVRAQGRQAPAPPSGNQPPGRGLPGGRPSVTFATAEVWLHDTAGIGRIAPELRYRASYLNVALGDEADIYVCGQWALNEVLQNGVCREPERWRKPARVRRRRIIAADNSEDLATLAPVAGTYFLVWLPVNGAVPGRVIWSSEFAVKVGG